MYKVSNVIAIIVIMSILGLYSCKGEKEQNYKDCESFSYSEIAQSITLKGEILTFDDVINPTKPKEAYAIRLCRFYQRT
jgi:hypothetical protein